MVELQALAELLALAERLAHQLPEARLQLEAVRRVLPPCPQRLEPPAVVAVAFVVGEQLAEAAHLAAAHLVEEPLEVQVSHLRAPPAGQQVVPVEPRLLVAPAGASA